MFKRILVPVDGSDTSNKALSVAIGMAREGGGELHLVHCVDELAYMGAYDYAGAVIDLVRQNGARVLDEGAAASRAAGVEAQRTFIDAPGQRLGTSIAQQAGEWKADLIVVGTHGRRGVSRLMMGSGAEQIIRLAPTPVLVVRGGEPGNT